MSQVELELRALIATYIAGVSLYSDDGEMQDASMYPFIDFLRDSPALINKKLMLRVECSNANE